MNRADLRLLLEAEGVPVDAYSLGGQISDECLCLRIVEGGWTVFYSERGGRSGAMNFDTEDEACDYMATRLLAASSDKRASSIPNIGVVDEP